MKVRDAMSTTMVTVAENTVVVDALKILVRKEVSGAPVVCDDNKIIGLVTEFDLLLAIDFVGENVPVSKIMSTQLVTVDPDDSLEDVRELLLTNNFRRLPVVHDGIVLGVISRRDILRVYLSVLDDPESLPVPT